MNLDLRKSSSFLVPRSSWFFEDEDENEEEDDPAGSWGGEFDSKNPNEA
jgi:hypothetical protein